MLDRKLLGKQFFSHFQGFWQEAKLAACANIFDCGVTVCRGFNGGYLETKGSARDDGADENLDEVNCAKLNYSGNE